VKPRLLPQIDGIPGCVHLEGVRHPMLLMPCLAGLPDILTAPAFLRQADDGSGSLSESDLDITTSWGSTRTDSRYSSTLSSEDDRKAGKGSAQEQEALWPTALDLRVPEGIHVVAVTGPNTGVCPCFTSSILSSSSRAVFLPAVASLGTGAITHASSITCSREATSENMTGDNPFSHAPNDIIEAFWLIFKCRWQDGNAQDSRSQCVDGPGRHVPTCCR
jgi:hypothetical protein